MHCRIFGSLRHGDNTPAYRWTPHPFSLQVKSFLNIVVLSFLKSVTGNIGKSFQKSTGVRSQWLPSSFIRKGVGYDIYYKTGLAPVGLTVTFQRGGFTGYFPTEHLELPRLSPTIRQSVNRNCLVRHLSSVSQNAKNCWYF